MHANLNGGNDLITLLKHFPNVFSPWAVVKMPLSVLVQKKKVHTEY